MNVVFTQLPPHSTQIMTNEHGNCVFKFAWELLSPHPIPTHNQCVVQLCVPVNMNVVVTPPRPTHPSPSQVRGATLSASEHECYHRDSSPHPTPLHDQCMQVILPCVALESFWWRKWGPLDSQVMRNTVSRSAWDHVQFSPHQLDSCTYLFYPGSAWPPSGCKVGRRCLVTCRNWVRTCFSCLRGPIQL